MSFENIKDNDISDMQKLRYMDITGEHINNESSKPQANSKITDDTTVSHPSLSYLRNYNVNAGGVKPKRSESADFSDHMVIKRPNKEENGQTNMNPGISSQSDLYSPQRRYDLDLDPNNRATEHKFHPYQENQTSHTITPMEGCSQSVGEHNSHL